MSRVIGILSGKGGVGKTTIVANLGAALNNEFKKNVLVVDSNIKTSHLGLHLGLYEDLPITLKEVLNKKSSINYAIYIHPKTGMRLLPAPLNSKDVNFDRERFQEIINQLRRNYDIILLDIAPGLGRETIIASSVIDEGIIVTTPDIPSVTDAVKTIDLLKRFRKKVKGIVINRRKGKKYELTVDEIINNAECELLSIIPEDANIPVSISKGVPLIVMNKNSSASFAITTLAGKIINKDYEPSGFIYLLKKTLGMIPDFSYNKSANKKIFIADKRCFLERKRK